MGHVFVRPEAIRITTTGMQVTARLEKSCFRGPGRSCLFELPSGERVKAFADTRCCLLEGETYGLNVERDGVSFFLEPGGERSSAISFRGVFA